MRKKPIPPCPKCSSKKVIPIAYGNPNYELFEESQQGKVILGGCIIRDDNPNWHCTECGKKW